MIDRSTDINAALRSRSAARQHQRGYLLNPYRFGPPGDPYFANVVALLHGNGADTSTTIIDDSASGKTYTANGNAQIDTAQSKFGGASMLFDGTGDYISTPHHADHEFGTGDFTVECWVRFNSLAGGPCMISNYQSAADGWSLFTDGSAKLVFNCTGDGVDAQGVTTLTTGVWYHVAASRTGSTLKLFLDGVEEDSVTNSALITCTVPMTIGRLGSFAGLYLNGWIDDVRITKGVGRYTAGFTPPAVEFPDS